MSPDDPRHGTNAGYRVHYDDDEPACAPCTDAAARYERGRQLDILNGHDRLVPKLGAARRLRALMAIGWPRRELARRAGYTGDALAGILNGRRQTILRATHDLVIALYDELSMTPGPSSRTRAAAAAAGWDPPLAWEGIDIDDPDATADRDGQPVDDEHVDEAVVERILAGDPAPARHATPLERHLVVTRWPTTGRPYADLAELTGWEPSRYRTPSSRGDAA